MRRRAGRRAWRSDGGALRRRAERSTGSASHRELSSAQTARARTCFTRLAVRSLPAGWSEPASRRAGNQSACNALNCWSSAECMYCAGAKVAKVRPGPGHVNLTDSQPPAPTGLALKNSELAPHHHTRMRGLPAGHSGISSAVSAARCFPATATPRHQVARTHGSEPMH
jgi:hypothetical protein